MSMPDPELMVAPFWPPWHYIVGILSQIIFTEILLSFRLLYGTHALHSFPFASSSSQCSIAESTRLDTRDGEVQTALSKSVSVWHPLSLLPFPFFVFKTPCGDRPELWPWGGIKEEKTSMRGYGMVMGVPPWPFLAASSSFFCLGGK